MENLIQAKAQYFFVTALTLSEVFFHENALQVSEHTSPKTFRHGDILCVMRLHDAVWIFQLKINAENVYRTIRLMN